MTKKTYRNIAELQEAVGIIFTNAFGLTPLQERLKDIGGEVDELRRYHSVNNIKEECGDALASLIQLANECGWQIEDLILATLDKIKRRQSQYAGLGRKRKVAILGGAFNPIHKGHIQTAQLVLDASQTFDEVWLMPAYRHMYHKEMAPPEQRLEMCRLAAQADLRIKVFDYEIANQLHGETYNFVKRLLQEDFAKDENDFSFILGSDNANSFMNWPNSTELERMMRFVIVSRHGYKPKMDLWYSKHPHIYIADERNAIMDISSTEVRKMLVENDPKVINYLDASVLDFIRANNLYI